MPECCEKKYWACPRCGESPMYGSPDTPPERCRNTYCSNTEFVYKTTEICCQRHHHHLGTTCPHCGAKG